VAVKSQQDGTVDRIDLPMRDSAVGYYANLNRVYRHLHIPVHPVRFLFVFAKVLKHLAGVGQRINEGGPGSNGVGVDAASYVPFSLHTLLY
jgi:hypothetical protein